MQVYRSTVTPPIFSIDLFPVRFLKIFVPEEGIAIGCRLQVLPWTLILDVIEYDAVITNERSEGAFYGVKGLANNYSA